ncbi:MAG: 3-hydroxyacyl-CoA dehydrogenase family protein [Pseudonocardiaceae bacterium]
MTRQLAVLGAGVMGVGIATLAVGHGLPVVLIDIDEDKLATAPGKVAQQLRMTQLIGGLPRAAPAGELRTATSVDAVAQAGAVVEAVTELPELKAKVLAEVSAVVRPGTVILSNTSAIPVDELASSTSRPGEVVGVHFMNPPYLIRTVEVVRGPRTEPSVVDAATALLAALDRDCVVVGDGPGFVINRILQRVINEAARIVEEGIATPDQVDALFQGCLGHRTGPLATADLIGLDNVVDSLRVLHERTGDAGYRPCELLVGKVREGNFGRKTGTGFYEHGKALT